MGRGNRDLPIKQLSDDLFKLDNYYNGLEKFIRECETPMTIAIQGDWGSGKTSIMNIVQTKLSSTNHIKTLYFNTWHYAQFTTAESLPLAFLSELVDEILKVISTPLKLVKEVKNAIRIFLSKTSLSILASVKDVGGEITISELININESFYKEIKTFTKKIAKAVNSFLKKDDQNRIVIFIDDLDRVEPLRAVELLEIIKIFLDIPGCVFVLAIDYEVVTLGVAKKYGSGMMYEKGKSFFDKMIQVPFRVPMASYKIEALLQNTFELMGIEADDDTKLVTDIIRHSIGMNPRMIKRLLNSYELISDILGIKKKESNVLLLAILSIQLYDEALYLYLSETREWTDMEQETIFRFTESPEVSYADFLSKKLDIAKEKRSAVYYRQTRELFKLLDNYIHGIKYDDESDEASHFEVFIELLSQSQITSAGIVRTSKYIRETLDENLELTNRTVKGFSIDSQEEYETNNFREAFVQILEKVVEKEKFVEFVRDQEELQAADIPKRMIEFLGKEVDSLDFSEYSFGRSAVKLIHGENILLHYSSNSLSRYLQKFLKAFSICNQIELLIEDI